MSASMNRRPPHSQLTENFSATAERLQRSTVHVRNGRMGSGSGVIWRADGLIVTNAHVVGGAQVEIELWDGQELAGEVMGRDQQRDLAAVRIEATELPGVTVGDSDALRVGQIVVAVGNPLGLSGAMSTGIIHAIAPTREGEQRNWVQADLHLAPGNSGGPLADVQGRVVGISSMVYGGLGLAIPSNEVTRFLEVQAPRPRLGIRTLPALTSVNGGEATGILLLEIEADSPAERAGLIPGDILTGAGGTPFGSSTELGLVLQRAGANGEIALQLLRGGQPIVSHIQLGIEGRDTRAAA